MSPEVIIQRKKKNIQNSNYSSGLSQILIQNQPKDFQLGNNQELNIDQRQKEFQNSGDTVSRNQSKCAKLKSMSLSQNFSPRDLENRGTQKVYVLSNFQTTQDPKIQHTSPENTQLTKISQSQLPNAYFESFYRGGSSKNEQQNSGFINSNQDYHESPSMASKKALNQDEMVGQGAVLVDCESSRKLSLINTLKNKQHSDIRLITNSSGKILPSLCATLELQKNQYPNIKSNNELDYQNFSKQYGFNQLDFQKAKLNFQQNHFNNTGYGNSEQLSLKQIFRLPGLSNSIIQENSIEVSNQSNSTKDNKKQYYSEEQQIKSTTQNSFNKELNFTEAELQDASAILVDDRDFVISPSLAQSQCNQLRSNVRTSSRGNLTQRENFNDSQQKSEQQLDQEREELQLNKFNLQKGFTTNRPEDQSDLHKILIKKYPRKDIRGDSSQISIQTNSNKLKESSSLITTNNNSRKSMLLDYKVIENSNGENYNRISNREQSQDSRKISQQTNSESETQQNTLTSNNTRYQQLNYPLDFCQQSSVATTVKREVPQPIQQVEETTNDLSNHGKSYQHQISYMDGQMHLSSFGQVVGADSSMHIYDESFIRNFGTSQQNHFKSGQCPPINEEENDSNFKFGYRQSNLKIQDAAFIRGGTMAESQKSQLMNRHFLSVQQKIDNSQNFFHSAQVKNKIEHESKVSLNLSKQLKNLDQEQKNFVNQQNDQQISRSEDEGHLESALSYQGIKRAISLKNHNQNTKSQISKWGGFIQLPQQEISSQRSVGARSTQNNLIQKNHQLMLEQIKQENNIKKMRSQNSELIQLREALTQKRKKQQVDTINATTQGADSIIRNKIKKNDLYRIHESPTEFNNFCQQLSSVQNFDLQQEDDENQNQLYNLEEEQQYQDEYQFSNQGHYQKQVDPTELLNQQRLILLPQGIHSSSKDTNSKEFIQALNSQKEMVLGLADLTYQKNANQRQQQNFFLQSSLTFNGNKLVSNLSQHQHNNDSIEQLSLSKEFKGSVELNSIEQVITNPVQISSDQQINFFNQEQNLSKESQLGASYSQFQFQPGYIQQEGFNQKDASHYQFSQENFSEVMSQFVLNAEQNEQVFDLPRALVVIKTLIAENNFLTEKNDKFIEQNQQVKFFQKDETSQSDIHSQITDQGELYTKGQGKQQDQQNRIKDVEELLVIKQKRVKLLEQQNMYIRNQFINQIEMALTSSLKNESNQPQQFEQNFQQQIDSPLFQQILNFLYTKINEQKDYGNESLQEQINRLNNQLQLTYQFIINSQNQRNSQYNNEQIDQENYDYLTEVNQNNCSEFQGQDESEFQNQENQEFYNQEDLEFQNQEIFNQDYQEFQNLNHEDFQNQYDQQFENQDQQNAQYEETNDYRDQEDQQIYQDFSDRQGQIQQQEFLIQSSSQQSNYSDKNFDLKVQIRKRDVDSNTQTADASAVKLPIIKGELIQNLTDQNEPFFSQNSAPTTQTLQNEETQLNFIVEEAQADLKKALEEDNEQKFSDRLVEIIKRVISTLNHKEEDNTKKQLQDQLSFVQLQLLKEQVNQVNSELNYKSNLLSQTQMAESNIRSLEAALVLLLRKFESKDQQSELLQKYSHLSNQKIGNWLQKAGTDLRELIDSCENRIESFKEQANIRAQKQITQLQNELKQEMDVRRNLMDKLQDKTGQIRIMMRIRPILLKEKYDQKLCYQLEGINKFLITADNEQGESKLVKYCEPQTNVLRSFTFDRVFSQSEKQNEIYDEVRVMIDGAILRGQNVCIMAYGQTSSGKTYTMIGNEQNAGLYFFVIEEIFHILKNLKDNKSKMEAILVDEISVSITEIYNEEIRDLLQKNPENTEKIKVKLAENKEGFVYSSETRKKIQTKNQLLKALRDACMNRTTGITKFNEYSSRSHFIMTIHFSGVDFTSNKHLNGKITLVDLAGSERLVYEPQQDNPHSQSRASSSNCDKKFKKADKDKLVCETKNINSSLAVLTKVLINLQQGNKHVPYRESKLTHFLKEQIGSKQSKTLMIIHLSPLLKNYNESISTLNFGANAQCIQKKSKSKVREVDKIIKLRQNSVNAKLQSESSFSKHKSFCQMKTQQIWNDNSTFENHSHLQRNNNFSCSKQKKRNKSVDRLGHSIEKYLDNENKRLQFISKQQAQKKKKGHQSGRINTSVMGYKSESSQPTQRQWLSQRIDSNSAFPKKNSQLVRSSLLNKNPKNNQRSFTSHKSFNSQQNMPDNISQLVASRISTKKSLSKKNSNLITQRTSNIKKQYAKQLVDAKLQQIEKRVIECESLFNKKWEDTSQQKKIVNIEVSSINSQKEDPKKCFGVKFSSQLNSEFGDKKQNLTSPRRWTPGQESQESSKLKLEDILQKKDRRKERERLGQELLHVTQLLKEMDKKIQEQATYIQQRKSQKQ